MTLFITHGIFLINYIEYILKILQQIVQSLKYFYEKSLYSCNLILFGSKRQLQNMSNLSLSINTIKWLNTFEIFSSEHKQWNTERIEKKYIFSYCYLFLLLESRLNFLLMFFVKNHILRTICTIKIQNYILSVKLL